MSQARIRKPGDHSGEARVQFFRLGLYRGHKNIPAPSPSRQRSLQALGHGEVVVIRIEGEKLPRIQIHGGGHMEDIETAMAGGKGPQFGNPLARDENIGDITDHQFNAALFQMLSDLGDHPPRLLERIADVRISVMAECLKSHRLPEPPQQQTRSMQRPGRVVSVSKRPIRSFLSPIQRTQEGSIWVSDQLRSPSSASRISLTPSDEKIGHPKFPSSSRAFSGAGGEIRATGLPCLVVSISCQSASQASI